VLKLDLPAESFDVVINCSTIEHVGLAGRYNIVKNESDGDLAAMKKLHGLMRPGGIMILTLPVGQDYTASYLHRVYGNNRLPKLLENYSIVKESYWTKEDLQTWVQVDREKALAYKIPEYNKPEDPIIYNIGCFVLKK
jgi:predicted SAM-dependent methyltransferase